VSTLTRAHQDNRQEEKLKQLVQPKLLIVDEIGYLPLDRLGANLLFQLVSRRYERGSILITSNQSPHRLRPPPTKPPNLQLLTQSRKQPGGGDFQISGGGEISEAVDTITAHA
jgi:hypothetical protein